MDTLNQLEQRALRQEEYRQWAVELLETIQEIDENSKVGTITIEALRNAYKGTSSQFNIAMQLLTDWEAVIMIHHGSVGMKENEYWWGNDGVRYEALYLD